jgi:hypothetical protein
MSGSPSLRLAAGLLSLAAFCTAAAAQAKPKINIWGAPPQEKPHFTKAAETAAPLPLPVTPQRRSEKKRPPAPPKLIANLANFSVEGWQGSPGAVDTLLTTAQENVKLWYGWEHLDIRDMVRKHTAGVRTKTPILYLCAYYPLKFTPDQRDALRDYVMDGGTMLINCCGQKDAYESAQAELKAMFAHRPLRMLPPDHPLYCSNYKIERVALPSLGPAAPFTAAAEDLAGVPGGQVSGLQRPRVHAISIGTRAAVLVSMEDLACGWNKWDNVKVLRYAPGDSNKLGINIMTYVTAELRLAEYLSRTREIQGPSVRPRQQFVLAQIIHEGNWDANPSGIPYFLKELGSNTSIAVKFTRVRLEMKNPNLFTYPLLYMTGTWDPALRDDEVALLRRHLKEGGTLIADAASGLAEFDGGFRELVRKLFPDARLEKLPKEHAVFSSFHNIDKLNANHLSEPIEPVILAVMHDNRPAILYSPIGMGDGWAQRHSAFARCYAQEDAVKLGTNLVVFAMQ